MVEMDSMKIREWLGQPKRCDRYEIGARMPYQMARLFVEEGIILLGAEAILSVLTTRLMML